MKDKDAQLIWETHSGRPEHHPTERSRNYVASQKVSGRDSYDKIMRDQEQFNDIAYKFYGDMEENELRLHHSILEDLLEMDPLSRKEAQGQGPQRD